MKTLAEQSNNLQLNGNITYDGTITKFFREVSYLHKRTMQAVSSVLQTFPKEIEAEIQTTDQLFIDRDYVDVYICMKQKDYEAIWKALMWGLDFTKSRKLEFAGLTTELDFKGIATYTCGKTNFDYDVNIYVATPLAEQLIQQFKAVEALRSSIVSLPFEELVYHKVACEKRISLLADNTEEHPSKEFLSSNILASRESTNSVGVN